METRVALIYKIIDANLWEAAQSQLAFKGAGIDLKDGYIHLSTADQMHETARLHFAGQENLVLVAVDTQSLANKLKWEASRGGQVFPHIYGVLEISAVVWAKPLPWNGTTHVFPREAV